MEIVCPRCGSKSNELIECDNCGAIGCIRCVRKSYGNWICHNCEAPERKYYSEVRKGKEVSNAFSAMFG